MAEIAHLDERDGEYNMMIQYKEMLSKNLAAILHPDSIALLFINHPECALSILELCKNDETICAMMVQYAIRPDPSMVSNSLGLQVIVDYVPQIFPGVIDILCKTEEGRAKLNQIVSQQVEMGNVLLSDIAIFAPDYLNKFIEVLGTDSTNILNMLAIKNNSNIALFHIIAERAPQTLPTIINLVQNCNNVAKLLTEALINRPSENKNLQTNSALAAMISNQSPCFAKLLDIIAEDPHASTQLANALAEKPETGTSMLDLASQHMPDQLISLIQFRDIHSSKTEVKPLKREA